MRRTFVSLCAAALMTAVASAPAAAAELRLEFTDLDVVFAHTSVDHALVDAASPDAGELDITQADPLASLDIFLDDVLVGSLSSNIWADLAIFGIEPIPASGGVPANAYGGTLDILFGNDQGFSLDLFDVELFLFNGGAKLSGSATASLFAQTLAPFNVAFDPDEPIDVVFALGPLQNTTSSGGFLTGFEADGTGSIIGEGAIVPEPASLILLGTGLIAAAAARRRAQR